MKNEEMEKHVDTAGTVESSETDAPAADGKPIAEASGNPQTGAVESETTDAEMPVADTSISDDQIQQAMEKIMQDAATMEPEGKTAQDKADAPQKEQSANKQPISRQQTSGNRTKAAKITPTLVATSNKIGANKSDNKKFRKKQKKALKAAKKPAADNAAVNTAPVNHAAVSADAAAKPVKNHTGLKIAAGLLAGVVVFCASVYGGFTYYYSNKFFPGTVINDINVGGLTSEETEALIKDKVENYSLTVTARGHDPQTIDGSSVNYHYVSDGVVEKVLKAQNPFTWVTGYFDPQTYTAGENIAFDKELVHQQMNQLACIQPDNQERPQNAYIAFEGSQFTIVPETEGNTLDADRTLKTLYKAVESSTENVNLEEEGLYITADVKQDDPTLAAELANLNTYAKASITYTFGSETEVLNGETIKTWLSTDAQGKVFMDEAVLRQKAADFVADMASRRNTIGSTRSFQTTTGRSIQVSGGNYGWQIAQKSETDQLVNEIKTGQVVTREPLYDSRALQHGESDIGNTYIEVDLSSQHMWFYRDGAVIFESDFVSGNMAYSDRMTPTGVCHLYYKQLDQVLRGDKRPDGTYEYESPVKYWMPFNGGVGFHDANWRSSFGGSIYMTSGSHGCINMPPSNAAVLYDLIDTSVPIIAFY